MVAPDDRHVATKRAKPVEHLIGRCPVPYSIAEKQNRELGLPITPAMLDQLHRIDERLGLGFAL